MTGGRAWCKALSLGITWLTGCADPLDGPSAYETQRFLCTEERQSEWLDLVEECESQRAFDGSCGGVVSFTGVLQGQPYTVESLLKSSDVTDVRTPENDLIRSSLTMIGASPYFNFRLTFTGLGGALSEAGFPEAPRTLALVRNDTAAIVSNEQVQFELRLNTRGASLELRSGSGEAIVREQTGEREHVRVSAELDQGGTLDGCFLALVTSRSIEVAEP